MISHGNNPGKEPEGCLQLLWGTFHLERPLKPCKLKYDGSFQGASPCNIIDGP